MLVEEETKESMLSTFQHKATCLPAYLPLSFLPVSWLTGAQRQRERAREASQKPRHNPRPQTLRRLLAGGNSSIRIAPSSRVGQVCAGEQQQQQDRRSKEATTLSGTDDGLIDLIRELQTGASTKYSPPFWFSPNHVIARSVR